MIDWWLVKYMYIQCMMIVWGGKDFRWGGKVRCKTWGGKVRCNSAAKKHPPDFIVHSSAFFFYFFLKELNHLYMFSDRSMEVELPSLWRNYRRPTNQQTDRTVHWEDTLQKIDNYNLCSVYQQNKKGKKTTSKILYPRPFDLVKAFDNSNKVRFVRFETRCCMHGRHGPKRKLRLFLNDRCQNSSYDFFMQSSFP